MTTPRIEELKHSFQELKRKSDCSLAINSPEQIAYCDALDDALPIVEKALTTHTEQRVREEREKQNGEWVLQLEDWIERLENLKKYLQDNE